MIGADGAHSAVRGPAFGPETDFAHYLGCYYAYWQTDNRLGLDHEGMATGDGRTAALSVFAVGPPAASPSSATPHTVPPPRPDAARPRP